MTIKRKLTIITLLCALLASISVFGIAQVAKGGRFHRYNLLHLKYNAELDKQIRAFKQGRPNIAAIRVAIVKIREQPIACLEEVNFLDVLVMKMIDTYDVVSLCEIDLKQGNAALNLLARFEKSEVDAQGLLDGLEKALNHFHQNSENFEDPVNRTVEFIVITMSSMVVLASIACIVLVFLLSRGILIPLKMTLERIRDISEGDGDLTLRLPVESRDELAQLAQSLNKFMERLADMLSGVRDISADIEESSENLNAASNGFQTTAHNLASSSEETSAVIEQLTVTIESVHDSIAGTTTRIKQVDGSTQEIKASITALGNSVRALSELIQQASLNSRRGQETIEPATTSMGNIRNSSSRIKEVTGVIGGISDQVTMLALNASIEAARAGDLGRGFAVVADEVSKLADKTSHSLTEISELVQESTTAVEDGVDRVNDIALIFNDIAERIMRVDSAMNGMLTSMGEQEQNIHNIAGNINSVRQVAERIFSSSQEQKQAILEINQAVLTVTTEAENVSSGVEGLTRMGNDLGGHTRRLTEMLGHFKF